MSSLFEPLPHEFEPISFLNVSRVEREHTLEESPAVEGPAGPGVGTLAAMLRTRVRTEVEAEAAEQLRSGLEVERSAITHALAGFANARTKYFAEMDIEVVRMALAVARKILLREVEADETVLRDVVHAALQTLKDKGNAALHVARSSVDSWKRAGRLAGLEIVGDETLNAGEVRLVTLGGVADLGIDAQLLEVEVGLFGEASKRSA